MRTLDIHLSHGMSRLTPGFLGSLLIFAIGVLGREKYVFPFASKLLEAENSAY